MKERYRHTIERRFGLRLSDSNGGKQLSDLVLRRSSDLGIDPDHYFLRIESDNVFAAAEAILIVQAATSGHTYFFRDVDQLERAVRSLTKQRRSSARVWCAGCSTGEEPFTLAMLAHDHGLDVDILATDLDPHALKQAESGRYAPLALRNTPGNARKNFFTSSEDGEFVVVDAIRNRVRFLQIDLMLPPPSDFPRFFDLVVCRNVLIYYRHEKSGYMVEQLANRLAEGGVLLLGTSDRLGAGLSGLLRNLERKNADLYHRPVFSPSHSDEDSGPNFEPAALGALLTTDYSVKHAPSSARPPARSRMAASGATHVSQSASPSGAAPPAASPRPALTVTDLHSLLGAAMDGMETHRFEEVAAALDAALALDDLHPDPPYLRGLHLKKCSDYREAATWFRRALFLQPEHWAASLMLTNVYERLGDQARRRAQLMYTIKLLDKGPTASPRWTDVEQRSGLPAPAAALRTCQAELRHLRGTPPS